MLSTAKEARMHTGSEPTPPPHGTMENPKKWRPPSTQKVEVSSVKEKDSLKVYTGQLSLYFPTPVSWI